MAWGGFLLMQGMLRRAASFREEKVGSCGLPKVATWARQKALVFLALARANCMQVPEEERTQAFASARRGAKSRAGTY